ncbi:MAG: DNA repair protein RadA [Chloroflexota bacterium]|nr:MAG: DNA repair protein RadA [Chloroflexota bacterium]
MPKTPKLRTQYVCSNCDFISPSWYGRCPNCESWDTLVETVEQKTSASSNTLASLAPRGKPTALSHVRADEFARMPIAMGELNRVLGGGIVAGSAVLISGEPGIGKSSLMLQLAAELSNSVGAVLYVSAEESIQQIKLRAERLGVNAGNLFLLNETSLEEISNHIANLKPKLVIVDSIQTVYSEMIDSAAGGVAQVKECGARLTQLAKSSNVPIFIIGHVTKAGSIAGPLVLQHLVDSVLYLEGERYHTYRLLRSVKNRFGATDEVGVFEMTQEGMVEVANPSEAFLAERAAYAAGNAIAVTLEGTRPLLCEIQALTSVTAFGLPRRTANGVDMNRLLLLTAVLTKRVGLKLYNQDIFVNVVGGLKINEPAADLSVAVAIASSFKDYRVWDDLAVMGEVGLSGELRNIASAEKRIKEASKLGFKRALVPYPIARQLAEKSNGIQLVGAKNLSEALELALIK